MRSFAEFLAESFHSEVPVTWHLKSTRHVVATFGVNDVRVDVDFEQRELHGGWHVGFTVVGQAEVSWAFRIFNGVFQAVQEFIDTRQPEVVMFVAKDEDLSSVYGTYLRREQSSIEDMGYRLEGPHHVSPYTEWTLRRMKPSDWKS